jgi:hypothetical protein
MSRQRLTRTERSRMASPAPANPTEGPAHPSFQGDPEASKYENGDTSSWAEDPTSGPYPNSAHPATPDEGPAHPAYKAAALERKAALCIRIATSMLGEPDGDPSKVAAIEDQALVLMDLPNSSIKASLKRLGADEEDEEEEDEASKKASLNEGRIARLERVLIRLAGEEDEEDEEDEDEDEASKKASRRAPRRAPQRSSRSAYYDEDSMLESMLEEEGMMGGYDEDSMLESMLEEEGMMGGYEEDSMLESMLEEEGMMGGSEEDSMLESMLEEEGMMGGYEEDLGGSPFMEEGCAGESMEAEMEVEMDGDIEDPMGVLAAELDGDEQQVLASLYGESKAASEDDGVRLRPQPKKASLGARKLGGPVAKEASSSEMDTLSALWKSAPDVSDHF